MNDFPPSANAALGLDGNGLTERGVQRSCLAQGAFLKVVSDEVVLPNGAMARRDYVVHPGAVMVVPLLDDGRVVLERQFRYPIGRVIVEFPAGKLDPGESSLACAQRELAEETGFRAAEWAYATTLHPLAAYSSEHIDVWFARGLTPGNRHLDDGEFLEVFASPVEQLLGWIREGAVSDGKTLAAALWLQNHRSGAWPLEWVAANAIYAPSPAGAYAPPIAEPGA